VRYPPSICAVGRHALDLRAPLEPTPATAAVLADLRAAVAGPGADRYLAPEIQGAVDYVRSGQALAAAESVTGRFS